MSPKTSAHQIACDALYKAAIEPESWVDALDILTDHFGGVGAMLVHNAPSGQPSTLLTSRLREDLGQVFLEHYVWNAWTLAMAKQPLERAVVMSNLLPTSIIRRTAFHADILAPQKIEDMLAIAQPSLSLSGATGGFAVALSSRGAETSRAAARRLNRLQPHLSRALELGRLIGERKNGTRQLERVLDFFPGPALLLGCRGNILYANPPAEILLNTEDGIAIEKTEMSRLRASNPVEDRILKQQISEALRGINDEDASLGGPVCLSRPSGGMPLFVLCSPLPTAGLEILHTSTMVRAIVLITDPEQPLPSTAKKLCISAGLTAAETRVTAMIGAGRSAPEVARTLGVSLATVKSQLASSYEKLGIHSQVALSRVLTALPGTASSKARKGP